MKQNAPSSVSIEQFDGFALTYPLINKGKIDMAGTHPCDRCGGKLDDDNQPTGGTLPGVRLEGSRWYQVGYACSCAFGAFVAHYSGIKFMDKTPTQPWGLTRIELDRLFWALEPTDSLFIGAGKIEESVSIRKQAIVAACLDSQAREQGFQAQPQKDPF